MKYALAASLLLLSWGCQKTKQTQTKAAAEVRPEPVTVETAKSESRRVDRSILVTGSLLPDEVVTVSSEVPGRIAVIHADFGQFVRKGAVIAELDKTEMQIAVDRSRAALAQALARVGLDPGQADKTPTSTPAIRQATAQFEDARFKYQNAAKLVKSGDISRERFTELEKGYRAREASLEAARDELRTQWANVEAIKAEVRLAEKRLRDTRIHAPFDGSISERKAAPGQYVKDNAPIVTLVKTNPMRLRLEVPESAAGVVRPGTAVEFTTDAASGQFLAIVREVNPALNEQSRTLIAEARLTNSDARLKPGMFAQVKLILSRDVEAIVVPRQAVYTVAGLTKFFVVRDGKAVEFRIPPGQMIGDWMEVPSDSVKAGEPVITTNLGQLVHGQEVRVKG